MKKRSASSVGASSGEVSVYTSSGVNLGLGDAFSAYSGAVCSESYGNNHLVKVTDLSRGNFRGPRGFQIVGLPRSVKNRTLMTMGSDGVGTKTIITAATLSGWDSACDLIAMLDGDVVRYGGFPAVMVNDLSVSTLGRNEDDPVHTFYQALMHGLGKAAKESGVVVMSGETAEMSHCISSEIHMGPSAEHFARYVWSGAMTGLLDPMRLIDGSKVKTGDVIFSLKDKLRSNGGSAMRRFFREAFGERWYLNPRAKALVKDAASPSQMYSPFFTTANGWHSPDQHVQIPFGLVANISGGGIRSKFAEVLLTGGHSAELTDLHEPCDSVSAAVQHFGMNGFSAYETFNGGNGMMFTAAEKHTEAVFELARKRGFEVKVSGRVLKSKGTPQVRVRSAFDGETFVYGLA